MRMMIDFMPASYIQSSTAGKTKAGKTTTSMESFLNE